MDGVRIARPEDGTRPSTRELVCDDRFCEVLADELQLKTSTVRTALIGEPKVRAIRVSEWTMRNAPDDHEHRGRLLIWWARKRGAGAFRPDDGDDSSLADVLGREEERFGRLAEALARMWTEHPESLAGAIKALERARNGEAG